MADKWFAECLPCNWEETHDSETGAVEAVQDHVWALHRDILPEERARLKMGHIQFRSEIAPQVESAPSAGLFPESPEPALSPTVEQDEPAEPSLPESVKFSPAKHSRKKAED